MSASVSTTWYSLIATTGFTAVLEDLDAGLLTTRSGYRATYEALGGDLALPWQSEHWTRFWSNYLPGIRQLKVGPGGDRAWEYLLPFEVVPKVSFDGPEGSTGAIRRYLYPWAVVAVADVTLDRDIPFSELAASVADSRRDRVWRVAGKQGTHNLEHLLRRSTDDAQGRLVVPGRTVTGTTAITSVAAPAEGSLSATEVALAGQPGFDAVSTGGTIAGLATLAPPGIFREDRLVAPNSSGDRSTRSYVSDEGHVLWNAQALRGEGEDSSRALACLWRNHVHAVAHIEALAFAARWAADRIRSRQGLSDGQAALIRPVVLRLHTLHEGDRSKTYASEVAKRRIEPLLDDLKAIGNAL